MTLREALKDLHERCEEFERRPYPKIYGLDHAIGENVGSCDACTVYAEEKCRRCSECPDVDHHWLEPENFIRQGVPRDDVDEDDVLVLQRCKHCPEVRAFEMHESDLSDSELGYDDGEKVTS